MINSPSLIQMNDGHEIPQLGYGVWQVADKEAATAVKNAIQAGYRSIDTAAIYRNEEGVGQGISEAGIARKELFLTTKVWNENQGYDETIKAFHTSLKKLKLEYVDLYLVHWPAPKKNKYVQTWKALEKLKEEGLVKSIGVSNFNIEHLKRVFDESSTVPVLNQIELHPLFQQKELREFHQKYNIVSEAWSPLARAKIFEDEVIVSLAKKYGKTPAQIVLRWHMDNQIVAIPKSVTPARISENFNIFDFKLSADDLGLMAKLDDSEGRIGPNPLTADF